MALLPFWQPEWILTRFLRLTYCSYFLADHAGNCVGKRRKMETREEKRAIAVPARKSRLWNRHRSYNIFVSSIVRVLPTVIIMLIFLGKFGRKKQLLVCSEKRSFSAL